jgi:hypothetical protein
MMFFRKKLQWITACVVLALAGCEGEETPNGTLVYTFEFAQDESGWDAFFSDYPEGEEEFYELEFQRTGLPAPLNNSTFALKLSGNNHSDDLMSLIYRKFEGLKPNTNYRVTFDIDMASITPSNSVGVGGSPDLAFGAGGISVAPSNTIDDQDHYRPNFEGFQNGQSNNVFKMLGRIGVQENTTQWTMINRHNRNNPITLKSNEQGALWLMMGTDSSFESTTTLYFKKITIRITP